MQKVYFFLALILLVPDANSQTANDTNYITRISSINWMPDGKNILLGVVKHHKTNRNAPFFSRVVLYTLASKKLTPLLDDGKSLATSPDGKTIAFLKRSERNPKDIHFYDIRTRLRTIIKVDTFTKNALDWSPDGNNLVYNVSVGKASQSFQVSVWVLNIETKKAKQLTPNDGLKSYNPAWCPDGKRIAYYLEKGDGRDQIWLTDASGSFYRNLSHDTSAHNYYPSWMDEKTLIYTKSPSLLMMMNEDGSNQRQIEGINATWVKYNAKAGQMAYIKSEQENKLMLFDWKKKTASEILDGTHLLDLFGEY